MTTDFEQPRSRRAVLAGLGGALGALAATALTRPLPVHAEGESIIVGGDYPTATSSTTLKNVTNDSPVLIAQSVGSGIGLMGTSLAFAGVYGSGGEYGVLGVGSGIGSAGVRGEGYARGVEAHSNAGTGLVASTQTGIAIDIRGRIAAPSVSGVAVIPAGATTKVVTPGVAIDITADAFVLLTPRNKLGGRDLWYTTDPAGDTFTIHLSKVRSTPTKVAWLLLG
jgi:hypothetical protein